MTLFPVWCITSVLPAGRSVWTWNTKDGISLPYCISCLHCYCSLLENCSIPRQRTWKRSDTPDTSSMLTATWRKVAGTDGMTSEGFINSSGSRRSQDSPSQVDDSSGDSCGGVEGRQQLLPQLQHFILEQLERKKHKSVEILNKTASYNTVFNILHLYYCNCNTIFKM